MGKAEGEWGVQGRDGEREKERKIKETRVGGLKRKWKWEGRGRIEGGRGERGRRGRERRIK